MKGKGANMAETRADKLNEILRKALPGCEKQIESGEWGPNGAPYSFSVTAGGKQRLVIKDAETGDSFGVVGETRDELLQKMAARFA
jgi:hypothetical protein